MRRQTQIVVGAKIDQRPPLTAHTAIADGFEGPQPAQLARVAPPRQFGVYKIEFRSHTHSLRSDKYSLSSNRHRPGLRHSQILLAPKTPPVYNTLKPPN